MDSVNRQCPSSFWTLLDLAGRAGATNIPEPFERAKNFCFVPKPTTALTPQRCIGRMDVRGSVIANGSGNGELRPLDSRCGRPGAADADGDGAARPLTGAPATTCDTPRGRRSPAPRDRRHQHREAMRGPLLGLLVGVPQSGIEAVVVTRTASSVTFAGVVLDEIGREERVARSQDPSRTTRPPGSGRRLQGTQRAAVVAPVVVPTTPTRQVRPSCARRPPASSRRLS
jgi:hypothetical protein